MPNAHPESWEYDLFVSYAHVDEEFTGKVSAVVAAMRTKFRAATGRELRVFFDQDTIRIAELWEDRIRAAIRRSAILVVMQTPSLLTSKYCLLEWDMFSALEQARRAEYGLLPYESLVFPVALLPFEGLDTLSGDSKRRLQEVRRHQSVDLVDLPPTSEVLSTRLDALVDDVIITLRKIGQAAALADLATTSADVHEASTPLVTTYPAAERSRFVRMIAAAQSATIVGTTHSWLAACLEEAILRKNQSGASTFWDHLQIVFVADEILPYIRDELDTEFSNRNDAIRERIRCAGLAKRQLMSLLLRQGVPGRWNLLSYPYVPPFIGSLFTLEGRKVVQLIIVRSSRREADSLHIDFLDRVDHYFESAFREIVEAAREEHEIVLVGRPGMQEHSFRCRSARFRRGVLLDDHPSEEWIPALVAICWRAGRNGPEPLLQLNTPRNSTRELGRVSHISGYINQRDCPNETDPEFDLPNEAPVRAILRELENDFSIRRPPDMPLFIDTIPFYYPDKENLFFYLLAQQLPPDHVYDDNLQMFSWTVPDLLRVRAHHVLSNVPRIFESPMTPMQRERAGHLLKLNLIAHDEMEVSDALEKALRVGQAGTDLVHLVRTRQEVTRVHRYASGRELTATGFAGLQYRSFFSHLLPAYVDLGVEGARVAIDKILMDESRQSAVRKLADLYVDREFMLSLPIEV